MTRRLPLTTLSFSLLLLIGGARSAAGQAPAAPGPNGPANGPLVLSPIDSRVVFAPDVKVTRINGTTGTLVGGYAGKLVEGKVLLGAGGYWLSDPHRDARLGYGGLVAGLRLLGSDRMNVSGRALVGLGRGTIYDDVSIAVRPAPRNVQPDVVSRRVGFRTDFLVVEPSATLQLGITSGVRLDVSAGYRTTSADRAFNDRLRGPTATVGLQFQLGR